MRCFTLITIVVGLGLLGCKREPAPDRAAPPVPTTKATPTTPAPAADAAAPTPAPSPTWYRAVLRAPDGVEVPFFLGVPPANAPGEAVVKIGDHEVRSPATYDGKTLEVAYTVHQTKLATTTVPDGTLTGAFTTTWRSWGASSIPLTAAPVAAPTPAALATVAATAGAPVDLGEARTVWKLAMSDSGTARLVIQQAAPGALSALLFLDTGNIIYLAGNGAGDTVVLAGFDGTSGYRLDLALAKDRMHATGAFVGGHKLDWREKLRATRGPDFELALKPRPVKAGAKIELPALPELAALPPGPLVIEIGGSWCSTCRNAAPLFVDLYREYQPRGLRMLTLLYEFDDDRTIDLQQAEAFKRTYGVTWPVVTVPGAIEDFTDIMPKGLTGLNPAGFPFTLFLAADHTLVALHAGFPARDATAEFERTAAEFRANIEKLLAPAPR